MEEEEDDEEFAEGWGDGAPAAQDDLGRADKDKVNAPSAAAMTDSINLKSTAYTTSGPPGLASSGLGAPAATTATKKPEDEISDFDKMDEEDQQVPNASATTDKQM